MDEGYDRLAAYCREQTGDSLQSVFSYAEDAAEIHYVREDMQGEFREGGLQELQEAVWSVHTLVLEESSKVEVLGDYRATIHTFDTAFAIQFLVGEREGVVATFDHDIGRNLHQFLVECERHV